MSEDEGINFDASASSYTNVLAELEEIDRILNVNTSDTTFYATSRLIKANLAIFPRGEERLTLQ